MSDEKEAIPTEPQAETAAQPEPSGFLSSWFGSSSVWESIKSGEALQHVQEQAKEVWQKYDQATIKEKLEEFKHTAVEYIDEADRKLGVIEDDAVNLITTSGSTLLNKVKEASENLSENLAKNEEPERAEVLFCGQDKVPISRLDSDLFTLHTSPETVLEKADAPEIVLDEAKNKAMLSKSQDLQQLYAQLVPAKLTDTEFWTRYLSLVTAIEENDKHRKLMLENEADPEDDLDDWGTSEEDK